MGEERKDGGLLVEKITDERVTGKVYRLRKKDYKEKQNVEKLHAGFTY